MEETKFFRFVWRFNNLTFMIAGVLAILLLLFGLYNVIKDITRDRSTRNIVNVQEAQDVKESWRLGYMSSVEGTPYLMIPLNSDQHYAQAYYSSKSSSSVRNYLFINSRSNDKHWLFPNNDYLISSSDVLSEREYSDGDRIARAILYKIVKQDSNKDNRLTNNDLQVLGMSRPDGKGYKEILRDIDVFIGHRLVDKNTLLILYQRKGIGYSARVDLTGFTLTSETELPKVGS